MLVIIYYYLPCNRVKLLYISILLGANEKRFKIFVRLGLHKFLLNTIKIMFFSLFVNI